MSYKSHSCAQSCCTGTEQDREEMHREKEFEAEMANRAHTNASGASEKENVKIKSLRNPHQNTFMSKSSASQLKTVHTAGRKKHTEK